MDCLINKVDYLHRLEVNVLRRRVRVSGDSSPRLYALFRTAMPGIKPVTRLPFGICAVAERCGACHLTLNKIFIKLK